MFHRTKGKEERGVGRVVCVPIHEAEKLSFLSHKGLNGELWKKSTQLRVRCDPLIPRNGLGPANPQLHFTDSNSAGVLRGLLLFALNVHLKRV